MQLPKWQQVRDAIQNGIDQGRWHNGDQLPTEAELCALFESSRHSVRKAVAELARESRLRVEQGRGTFIQSVPLVQYSIARRTRLRDNLAALGLSANSKSLEACALDASAEVAQMLRIEIGSKVYFNRNLVLADDLPIGLGNTYFDATRFPDLQQRRAQMRSMTKVWRSYGIDDYLRRGTWIEARNATPEEAKHLQQHPDMPVMQVTKIDVELDGTPLSYGVAAWSAARVKFDLSREEGA